MAGAGWRDFVAGEVLTAANVQDYLQDQAVMTFGGTAARGSAIASPSEGMVSYLTDLNQIQVFDGSVWERVYPPADGSVIQVQSAIKVDTFTTSSSTFVDVTGLSVTITPSSTSSRILVLADVSLSSASTSDAVVRLMRGATVIAGGTGGSAHNGFGQYSSSYNLSQMNASIGYVDLPNTTSATTYKIQVVQNGGTGTAAINRRGSDVSFGLASTIVVMELRY